MSLTTENTTNNAPETATAMANTPKPSTPARPLWRETLALRWFGLAKVPLLYACKPRVVQLDDTTAAVCIPLTRRTRNHYHSMYFGALSVGADCVGGILALNHIRLSGKPVALLFKDFHADFLKRPTDDVVFTCRDGLKVKALVAEAVASGQRVNTPLAIEATVPKVSDEVVARFTLTLSLRAERPRT